MSFNKAKALKSASKYVQQGKYPAAIEEYRKILQAEPGDITTLNTLGDLYVKIGDTSEAIRTFLKIAEHYRAGSFNLKAIAMLKKVSKLDPGNIDVALKLASLYGQQKLIVDARQQYLAVAEHYLRNGQQKQALDIYQQIANLDPENTAIQLKLAEAYLAQNQVEQAYEAFASAAAELQRQGKDEAALQLYLKALQINPTSQLALNSSVNLYIQRGESQRAAALISQLLQTQTDNVELLTILGRIHQSARNLTEAEKYLTRAYDLDNSRYQYLVDLGSVTLSSGDYESARRQLARVMETLHLRREEEKAISILHEIINRDPGNFGALQQLADIYARIRNDHNLIETLNTLADAAIRKGEDETAIQALVQLTQLEPDEIKHRRRLRSLGLSDEEVQRLSDPVSSSSSPRPSTTPVPAPAPSVPVQSDPQNVAPVQTSIPVWGEVEINGTPATPASFQPEVIQPQVVSDDSFTIAGYNDFESVAAPSEISPFNAFSASEMVEEGDYSDGGVTTENSGTNSNYGNGADSYGIVQDTAEEIAISTEMESSDSWFTSSFGEITTETAAETPVADNHAYQADSELKIEAELESLDFYIAQEMFDVARHTLDALAQQFPGHPEIQARRLQLDQAETSISRFTGNLNGGGVYPLSEHTPYNTDFSETTTVSDFSASVPAEANGSLAGNNSEVEQIFVLPSAPVSTELADTASDFTTIKQDVQKGSPFDDLLSDLNSAKMDVASGQAMEVPWQPQASQPVSVVTALPHTEVVTPAAATTPSSFNDLVSLFDDVKAGTEQEETDGDFDTHYNLGLAYKDMEMFDDAIEEFQMAYKALSADSANESTTQNQLLCCSMLGFCFSGKNMPRPAVMWLRKGLDVPGRTEDEYQALRYDLSSAYENMGEWQQAFDLLSEVYAIDVNYRNVNERLSQIQAQLSAAK